MDLNSVLHIPKYKVIHDTEGKKKQPSFAEEKHRLK